MYILEKETLDRFLLDKEMSKECYICQNPIEKVIYNIFSLVSTKLSIAYLSL